MVEPQDLEIEKGRTAVLNCRADGSPKPEIYWMYNHEKILEESDGFRIMENGSLVIQDIEEFASGMYECMAKNEDGEAKSRPARMTVVFDRNIGKTHI